MIKLLIQAASFVVLLTCGSSVYSASYSTNVIINGQELSGAELAALEVKLGTRVVPGNYIANYQSGCWTNLSTGASGCINSAGSYTSSYGSGERNSNGDWSHWSDLEGGGVGGTGDGCYYAFGWSNC